MKGVRTELAERLSVLDEESEERVQHLSKVYAAMPPERAAPLCSAAEGSLLST